MKTPVKIINESIGKIEKEINIQIRKIKDETGLIVDRLDVQLQYIEGMGGELKYTDSVVRLTIEQ